jgi:hypothetical protein
MYINNTFWYGKTFSLAAQLDGRLRKAGPTELGSRNIWKSPQPSVEILKSIRGNFNILFDIRTVNPALLTSSFVWQIQPSSFQISQFKVIRENISAKASVKF